jgi:uncharacterized membrane protein
LQAEGERDETLVRVLPIWLFLIGFSMMFAGMVVLIITAVLRGDGTSVSTGLVIFIGPIPVILGAGPNSYLALLFAVILTILGSAVFILLRRAKP